MCRASLRQRMLRHDAVHRHASDRDPTSVCEPQRAVRTADEAVDLGFTDAHPPPMPGQAHSGPSPLSHSAPSDPTVSVITSERRVAVGDELRRAPFWAAIDRRSVDRAGSGWSWVRRARPLVAVAPAAWVCVREPRQKSSSDGVPTDRPNSRILRDAADDAAFGVRTQHARACRDDATVAGRRSRAASRRCSRSSTSRSAAARRNPPRSASCSSRYSVRSCQADHRAVTRPRPGSSRSGSARMRPHEARVTTGVRPARARGPRPSQGGSWSPRRSPGGCGDQSPQRKTTPAAIVSEDDRLDEPWQDRDEQEHEDGARSRGRNASEPPRRSAIFYGTRGCASAFLLL